MQEQATSRTRMMIGDEGVGALERSHVAVFGIGGVGGYALEVLARSGIGMIDIYDSDNIQESNINRQILATHSTIGKMKVDVAANRIHDINPECIVESYKVFYLPANADCFDLSKYDYVLDCIDTITAKIELIKRCKACDTNIISCMGTANKMDNTCFSVMDIYHPKMDPIAKIIRKKLREHNIDSLKVVCSNEKPLKPQSATKLDDAENMDNASSGKAVRSPLASNAFVPAMAGLVMGGAVIKDLIADGTPHS